MESSKLPSKLSRHDDSEKLTLSKGQKTACGHSKSLPTSHDKDDMKKQQAKERKRRVRIPLVSSFISRIGRKRTTILHLEDRVLSNIYQGLSLVDGACLSLSCKRLYGLFGATLKQKQFDFPRLLQLRIPILCVNSTKVPRNQLLLQLENHRWKYCGKCLKLHPRKEFSRASLQYPARGGSCTEYAGIVDLCPCAAWTIRERGRIVKLLKSRIDKLPEVQIGPFNFDRTGGPHLSHSCLLVTTPNHNGRVRMRIFIDKTDHLVVHARYTTHLSTRLARAGAEPIFPCPHVDLNSLTSSESPNRDCPQCRSLIDRDFTLSQYKQIAVFDVKRDLGSCKWPADSRWLSNCRLTGDDFSKNVEFWYVHI